MKRGNVKLKAARGENCRIEWNSTCDESYSLHDFCDSQPDQGSGACH